MGELKLLESEEPKKKIDWKQERVNIFLEEFKLARPNDRYPLGYPAMMGMMYRMWTTVHGYTDEETGEIIFDIPDVETWREQAKGFFQDEFARKTRKFHFDYFIKQFGSFKVVNEVIPLKVKPQVKMTRVKIHCGDCGTDHYSDENCPI